MSLSINYRALIRKSFLVAVCFSAVCSVAFAGLITSVQMFGTEAGTGPGMGSVSDPIVYTPNPDNDNQVGGGPLDNNITVPIKRFDHAGYIDMVFNVVPTDGVTEYKIFESVDNNTGTDWNAYIVELGFGIGPNFVPSPPGDGLDFDAPTFDVFPVSSAFMTVIPAEDLLVFTNGIHSTGSEIYQFRIDVPNLPEMPGGIASFTMRQSMRLVPEPSTLVLLGIGAIGWLTYARRRRK